MDDGSEMEFGPGDVSLLSDWRQVSSIRCADQLPLF
jgi:hypothetical protein